MPIALTAQEEKARVWAELDNPSTSVAPQHHNADDDQARREDAAAPKETAAAQPAADEKQGAAADPYAGLPTYVKDEIVGMKSQLGQALTRLRQAEGHIGGLNSQLKQAMVQRAQQTTADAGGTAPSAGEIRAAQGDSKAMAKLIDEYPDFGAAVKGAVDEQMSAVKELIKQASPAAAPAAQPAVQPADLEAFKRSLLVESRHPGWENEVKTPAFHGWLQGQAREVQMLARSDDPQDAIRLLDLRHDAAGGGRNQQRLDAAAALPFGRNAPGARAIPEEQMTKAQYWEHLDQLAKQKA